MTHGETWLPPRGANLSSRQPRVPAKDAHPTRSASWSSPQIKQARAPETAVKVSTARRFCRLVPPGLTSSKFSPRRRGLELRQSRAGVGLFLSKPGRRWARWPRLSRFVPAASARGLLFRGWSGAGAGGGLFKNQVREACPGLAWGLGRPERLRPAAPRARHTREGCFPRDVLLGTLRPIHVVSSDLGKVSPEPSPRGLGALCSGTHPGFQTDFSCPGRPPRQGTAWGPNPVFSAGPAGRWFNATNLNGWKWCCCLHVSCRLAGSVPGSLLSACAGKS